MDLSEQIVKKTVFETTDGKQFKTLQEAEKEQKKINLLQWADNVTDGEYPYSNKESIMQFLTEQYDSLKVLFNK